MKKDKQSQKVVIRDLPIHGHK